METREQAAEYRLSHWRGVLQERNASGMSVRVYCRSIGLKENVYYYWQRKLREAAVNTFMEGKNASGITEKLRRQADKLTGCNRGHAHPKAGRSVKWKKNHIKAAGCR